jgi:sensor histidine kinase YesM
MPKFFLFLFCRKNTRNPLQFFLMIICFFFFNLSKAQQKQIDSLKKVLPSLNDTARINCLIQLCGEYCNIPQKDSIGFYAKYSYSEAKKIGDFHGLAKSAAAIAAFEINYHNDYPKGEKWAREALFWYNKAVNKEGIGWAYFELGYAFYAESKFDDAAQYLKSGFLEFKKAQEEAPMFTAFSLYGQVYRESGDYEIAFGKFREGLQLAEQLKSEFWISQNLFNIGDLYYAIEDYPNGLSYYQKAFQLRRKEDIGIWDYTIIAELFSLTGQYDSASYYYSWFDPMKHGIEDARVFLTSKGEYFLLRKEYNSALDYFTRSLRLHQQFNDRNQVKRVLLNIARTYNALENNKAAIIYARQGLTLAIETRSKQYIRDGYQILYSVYDRMHQTDSAYVYYRKYVTMKETVANDQSKGKFAAYNYDQKIALMNKEKQVNQQELKLSKQQLQQESLQKKILIAILLFLSACGFFLLRYIMLKRKNENQRLEHELKLQELETKKTKAELQHKTTELEMRALRSQMNPHFIFNCLSSINRFTLKNKTEEASDYLTKFSRLIRMVLNNSKREFISLEDELETLRLYLEMERLRFKNSFDYSFTYNNAVDIDNIFIPPLLLQPFAENAIWHGLMHKQQKGFLNFNFSAEEKFLNCTITDNGVGREQAELLKSKSAEKQKSMGLKITSERLSLLNNNSNEQTFFTIEDLADENENAIGTRVHLKIFYKEMIEV